MTLSNLGLALADAGQAEAAIDTQTSAHQLFQAALGPTHASTLMAGRRRAVALAKAGRTTAAVFVIKEVLDALADRVGEAELGAIAGDVALIYAAAGDTEAARYWRLRAT
jgi:ABC-type transport system involved in cytochrome c biogenesis ATPase subunit